MVKESLLKRRLLMKAIKYKHFTRCGILLILLSLLCSCSGWGKFAGWDDYKELMGIDDIDGSDFDFSWGPKDDPDNTNNEFYEKNGYKVLCSGGLLSGNRQVDYGGFTLNISDEAKPGLTDFTNSLGVDSFEDIRKVCANAFDQTLDCIVVGEGYKVIIYSEKNFEGEVQLEAIGPAVIYNIHWKDHTQYSFLNDILVQTWDDSSIESVFPPDVRSWSATDMHNWSGSMKILTNF